MGSGEWHVLLPAADALTTMLLCGLKRWEAYSTYLLLPRYVSSMPTVYVHSMYSADPATTVHEGSTSETEA